MVDSKESYKIDLGKISLYLWTVVLNCVVWKWSPNRFGWLDCVKPCKWLTTNWKLIPFAIKVHKPFESIKWHLKSILKLFVHTVDNKYLIKHLGPHWKLRIPIPALLTYDLHGLHVNNYYKVWMGNARLKGM